MANRVPLIINTNANQIQELAVGDHLDLTGSGISNAGIITATKFVGDGSLLTNIGGGAAALSNVVDDVTPQLGGNLDINNNIINGSGTISISGNIQATSFTGPLIGNVTGNVTGNADTANSANTATTATSAAGLTGSPAIQVASIVVSGNILADTVSVASTLTYEDVTNIDSVGVVTARTGIKVLANGIDVVGVVTATSFSGDGSGLTNLPSDVVNDTTPQLGGNLDLNSKDITGTGNIDITGNLDVSGTSTFGANGSITSGGNFTLSGNGLTITGSTTTVGEFKGATLPTIQITQTTDNTDLQLRANADGGLVRTATNKPLILGSNQQERLRIGTGGNGVTVGINTTANLVTGSEVLSVRGYSSFKSYNKDYAAIYTYSEGEGVGNRAAHLLFNWGGANRGGFGVETDNATLILNNQNGISFRTGATGLNGAEKLHISSAGNIGIQTNAPADAWLDIASTAGTESIRMRRLSSDVNVASNWAFKAYGKNLYFREGSSSPYDRVHFTDTGNVVATGTVSDSKGELRNLPQNLQSGYYAWTAEDAGKHIYVTGNVGLGFNGVHQLGDMITYYNASGSTITSMGIGAYVTFIDSANGNTYDNNNQASFSFAANAFVTFLMVKNDATDKQYVMSGTGLP